MPETIVVLGRRTALGQKVSAAPLGWVREGGAVAVCGPWPVWEPDQEGGLPSLVRYVSTDAIRDLGLMPKDVVFNGGGSERGREVARKLYQSMASAGLTYGLETWSPGRVGQRIRDARRVRSDKGTCLDLTVLFAAMCVQAQLRPILALAQGDTGNHAFVIVDLRAPLNDIDGLPGVFLPTLDRGVYRLSLGATLPGDLRAIDVTAAAADESGRGNASFDDACVRGAAAWTSGGYDRIDLVDVKTVRVSAQYTELPRPDEGQSPPISTRLPDMPPFENFTSRQGIVSRLERLRGSIVIYGKPGMGKSMLAHHRALAADHGYGWFLTASDRDTLTTSLALAEAAERGRSAPGLGRIDRSELARDALTRLQHAAVPWVVVLDNANQAPSSDLLSFVPRPTRDDQTLIVTTTAPEWGQGAWASGRHVQCINVGPLDTQDVARWVPTELHEVVDGSPLVMDALQRCLSDSDEADLPHDVQSMSGPQLVWELVQRRTTGDAHCRALAELVAWLPAELTPVAKLCEILGDVAGDAVERLIDLGLLSGSRSGEILMHRLFGQVIRQGRAFDIRAVDLPHTAPAFIAVTATPRARELLTTRSAAADLETLCDAITGWQPTADQERLAGLALRGLGRAFELRGRVEMSAKVFAAALDRLPTEDNVSVVECLVGRARWTNENANASRDEIEAAMRWVNAAIERSSEDRRDYNPIRYEGARAMLGLLLRKLARTIPDRAHRKELLEEAHRILLASKNNRQHIYKSRGIQDDSNLDRAQFNLGGIYVDLAQLSDPAEAAKYLDEAWATYDQVRRVRVKRYGRNPTYAHPHIAACTAGLALTDYYRALIGTHADGRTADLQQRMDWLRSATKNIYESLMDREHLAGELDGNDCNKSIDVLLKVLQARRALLMRAPQEARETWESRIREFDEEARRWGMFPSTDMAPPAAH